MKLQIVQQLLKPEEQSSEFLYILPNQITEIENGTCTYIELNNVLDLIPDRLAYLNLCIQKLRTKGILSFYGIDIIEFSKLVLNGQLTIDDINKWLYADSKQSVDIVQRLIIFCINNKLQILEKRISGIIYYLKVVK